jgi:hypothetical protein
MSCHPLYWGGILARKTSSRNGHEPKPQTQNPKPQTPKLKLVFLRIGAFLGEGHAGEVGIVCGVLRECILERYGGDSIRDVLRLEVMTLNTN